MTGSDNESAPMAPVIGVLTQPLGPLHESMAQYTYFPASYSKYAAMSGARTVAVLCDTPKEDLRKLYKSINGLLVPGGKQDLKESNLYHDAVVLFTKWAMEDFDETGEIFPIHYTCLGLESLVVFVEQNRDTLSEFEGASGVADVLHWTPEAKDAWSLRFLSEDVKHDAMHNAHTYEAHTIGVWTKDFKNSEKLSSFFTLLSDTPDANGQDYISIIEAKRYPFIAVQFHPEQPCFEWHNPKVPHSTNAVRLSQALSLAFVERSRHSSHRFPSQDELLSTLLYNHTPRQGLGIFDELYCFEYQKSAKDVDMKEGTHCEP